MVTRGENRPSGGRHLKNTSYRSKKTSTVKIVRTKSSNSGRNGFVNKKSSRGRPIDFDLRQVRNFEPKETVRKSIKTTMKKYSNKRNKK